MRFAIKQEQIPSFIFSNKKKMMEIFAVAI